MTVIDYVALVRADSLTSTLDCSQPFAACRLCGAVFQSDYDRNIVDSASIALSWEHRRSWTYEHAREHPVEEHVALEESGKVVTDEARRSLEILGICLP